MLSRRQNVPSKTVGRLGFILGFLLFVSVIPEARANTYLFSVTGGQILDALETVGSDADNVPSAGYFAIFLKPTGIGSFTYNYEIAPGTNSLNTAWEASTITDFSLGTGTYARFSKQQNQGDVAILSRANGLGTNIFLGFTWSDASTWPIAWGGVPGTIVEVLNEAATFRFAVDTPGSLAGSYFLTGRATELVSSSSLSVDQPKTQPGVTFYLEVTPVSIPEPSTYVFGFSGILVLALASRRHRSVR